MPSNKKLSNTVITKPSSEFMRLQWYAVLEYASILTQIEEHLETKGEININSLDKELRNLFSLLSTFSQQIFTIPFQRNLSVEVKNDWLIYVEGILINYKIIKKNQEEIVRHLAKKISSQEVNRHLKNVPKRDMFTASTLLKLRKLYLNFHLGKIDKSELKIHINILTLEVNAISLIEQKIKKHFQKLPQIKDEISHSLHTPFATDSYKGLGTKKLAEIAWNRRSIKKGQGPKDEAKNIVSCILQSSSPTSLRSINQSKLTLNYSENLTPIKYLKILSKIDKEFNISNREEILKQLSEESQGWK